MFCQYKDALGKPNEGVHSYRLFGVAIVDLSLTLIGSIILSYFIYGASAKSGSLFHSFLIIFIILIILGIIAHRLFCVNTTLNMKIFGVV